MAYATTSIASRIEWCQRQRTQTCAQLERAGWQAEEAGLWDALLNRDRTTQYQQGPPAVFERYALGLQDGHAMMRTATVSQHFATPTRKATTGSNAGIDGMDHVSTRHIMGLTKRARKYLQECRVTGHHKQ
ncbi:MAG TPA: hypothetical protein VGQ08_09470 [Nitrospiraceae bacterium]|jgi:hypothetical protein|nr:hypothetical protein [Nitrospiraceae bacterium]